MCLPKTPRVLRGAPRGCTHRRHRALKGTPKVKSNKQRQKQRRLALRCRAEPCCCLCFCFCFCFRSWLFGPPFRRGKRDGLNPAGAAHTMCAVFGWHMDVPSENSRPDCGPRRGAPPGACFFGYFLCTSKESDARCKRVNRQSQCATRVSVTVANVHRAHGARYIRHCFGELIDRTLKEKRRPKPPFPFKTIPAHQRMDHSTFTSTRRASSALPSPVVSIGLLNTILSAATPLTTSHCWIACARCLANS